MKWIKYRYNVERLMIGNLELAVVEWSSVRDEKYRATCFSVSKANFQDVQEAKRWAEERAKKVARKVLSPEGDSGGVEVRENYYHGYAVTAEQKHWLTSNEAKLKFNSHAGPPMLMRWRSDELWKVTGGDDVSALISRVSAGKWINCHDAEEAGVVLRTWS